MTMETESILKEYYNAADEDSRLLSRHGRIEYLTTMRYVEAELAGDRSKRVLEIGAGTGRYSLQLAREGYGVTAVELVEHNIDVFKSHLKGGENLRILQGNALDLSMLGDGSFELTLLLGPMYHLYTFEDKLRALSEAVRVTAPGGAVMVAYCMNEATVIQYAFGKNKLAEVEQSGLLAGDWHCLSSPREVFDIVRTEDIAELDSHFDVVREKLTATDGAAHYLKGMLEEMDEETYGRWLDYHFATCERQDLVGASNHTLDILRKN